MRLKSLALGALGAAGLVLSSGGVAAAAPVECSITAPSKVTIDQPYREHTVRFSSGCQAPGVEFAGWEFMHPTKGSQDVAIYMGNLTEPWDLYDMVAPGVLTLRPIGVYDADFNPVPDSAQNTTTTTVKLGARVTATAKRADGILTLSTTAKVYSPKISAWAARPKTRVSLMHKAPGSTAWKYVKSGTSTNSGKVSLSVVPKAGMYRLAVGETPSVWAASSAAVRGK